MGNRNTETGQIESIEELLLDDEAIAEQVLKIKRDRNAVILVHNYQRPEVQEIGDFVGDSLGLARQAAKTDADIVVFCGVHFMAETAYIINPSKLVLLPEMLAGCPLADMVTAQDVRRSREEHPGATVVSYVNTSADVKAESDYCCTSGNAIAVVKAVETDEILFFPDRNLGAYVAGQVPEKNVIAWDGYCPVHEHITAGQVRQALDEHPGAEVIAHPECRPEVLEIAHHVKSTSGMLDAALSSDAATFIVATEEAMLHQLTKAVPFKEFLPPAGEHICPNMKLITLSKVLWALQTLEPRVVVPEEVRGRALRSVERMLALG
jgi:quinolinate synthase